jgi:hypothetical protein
MACLPTRVQRVLWDRLKRYNCVFSPDTSSTFGGVCICSGGSYKQLCDWYYNEASLFQASFVHSKDQPVIFCVSGASDLLLANGYYLKTSHEFNQFPVYAQLNESVVKSDSFREAIASETLYKELLSKAPDFAFKFLRAGERLLVRQESGWAVQSVSAFRGHLQTDGDCGFHILYFPDQTSSETLSVKTFAGMKQDLKTIQFKDCSSSKLLPFKTSSKHFKKAAKFTFNIGSKRCVECCAAPGTKYRPEATRIQQLHADGPWTYDAATDWRPRHPDVKVLHGTSASENIQPLPACNFAALLLSLSALLAFFPFTALGTARKNGRFSNGLGSLKVPIHIGRACVFRFDWLHHGWSCCDALDPNKLPVHYRAHFYMLSGLLRDLPLQDVESMFEFLSAISHDEMDEGTRQLLLECLQTFVPWKSPEDFDNFTLISSDQLARERGYSLFDSQQALDDHISNLSSKHMEGHKKRRHQ